MITRTNSGIYILCILSSVILTLGILQPALAQSKQATIDSLQDLLRKETSDTGRIVLLGQLTVAYARASQKDMAYRTGVQASLISRSVVNPYYQALTLYRSGTTRLIFSDFDSAITYLSRARSLTDGDTSFRARQVNAFAGINLALAYDNSGHPDKSMDILTNSVLPLIEELKDTSAYVNVLHNLGATLVSAGEYIKAYPYIQKDVAIAEKAGSNGGYGGFKGLATSYLNAAVLMYHMDSTQRCRYYLQKARSELDRLGKDFLWTRFYSYQTLYYIQTKQYALAEQSSLDALSLAKTFNDRQTLYDTYNTRKMLFKSMGNARQARNVAYIIEKMAIEDSLTDLQMTSLKDIATLSQKLGDLSTAYSYLSRYLALKDSVDTRQTALRINEMEARYRAGEKQKQILALQADKKQQQLSLQRSRFVTALLVLGLIFVLLVLFFVWKLYRDRQRAVQREYELQITHLQQEQKIRLYDAMLQGQEMERSRLSRDLHDGLGGMLAGVKINLSEVEQGNVILIPKTIQQLDQSVAELRRIAHNLMPGALLHGDLRTALQDFCEQLSTGKMNVELQLIGLSTEINQRDQIIIYRIIQELLVNTLKHAAASEVFVQCSQSGNRFYLTVEDNGKGFDPAVLKPGKGIGLESIRSRVEFLDGKMELASVLNKGTVVNIELSVTEED